ALASGSYGAAGMSLTFSLNGASTGNFTSSENGNLNNNSTSFHIDKASHGSSLYNMAASVNSAGWGFGPDSSTGYTASSQHRFVDDAEEGDQSVSQTVTVTGTGTAGTQITTGSYSDLNESYTFPSEDHPSPPVSVTLVGPEMLALSGWQTGVPLGSLASPP